MVQRLAHLVQLALTVLSQARRVVLFVLLGHIAQPPLQVLFLVLVDTLVPGQPPFVLHVLLVTC